MDPVKLGRRIKEARLAKKMTQTEVVGSFITRNMLSQIESGTATPSMKTLEYLSGVLGLSLPELMAQSPADNTERLLTAKRALKSGLYDKVIETVGEIDEADEFYDEYCALLALAYRGVGNTEAAEHYSALGIYLK